MGILKLNWQNGMYVGLDLTLKLNSVGDFGYLRFSPTLIDLHRHNFVHAVTNLEDIDTKNKTRLISRPLNLYSFKVVKL